MAKERYYELYEEEDENYEEEDEEGNKKVLNIGITIIISLILISFIIGVITAYCM